MRGSAKLYGLVITQQAIDNLERIPLKIRAQLIKRAKALILNPKPQGSIMLKGTTTKEGDPVYRQRSGDYRIIYIVKDKPTAEVVVLDIDNRKDVYR